jgi:hypothetical protein
MNSDLQPIPMTANTVTEDGYLMDDPEAFGVFSPFLCNVHFLSSLKTTFELWAKWIFSNYSLNPSIFRQIPSALIYRSHLKPGYAAPSGT